MKIDSIDVEATLKIVREGLEKEPDLSPALRSALDVLLTLVTVLLNRITLNSRNSSKPPSEDHNRNKKSKKGSRSNKPGGQPGHQGSTLKPVDDPDEVAQLHIDRRRLPKGRHYRDVGYEARQVIDIEIRRFVTEYRAQVLEDDLGHRYIATFPEGITRPAQYGDSVKAHAVYLSQFQLMPYDRIRDHFHDQIQIPVSAGSIFNFNQEAYQRLEPFEHWVKTKLTQAMVIHADETGINVHAKRHWLHCASTDQLTWFDVHTKRGKVAMDDIGILPQYRGVLCHDHWKPYYQYTDCLHALCNAHHLRELERAWEQDGQVWAKDMKALMLAINEAVEQAGDCLPTDKADTWRKKYQALIEKAENECPPPDESQRNGKRGRLKRSKARNLLERLRDFEQDVLRFMVVPEVPFTNNQGENDIRMTKVQQKISGCFRSFRGAQFFCRIRSYLSTCRKQGVSATEALSLLFAGDYPAFMSE